MNQKKNWINMWINSKIPPKCENISYNFTYSETVLTCDENHEYALNEYRKEYFYNEKGKVEYGKEYWFHNESCYIKWFLTGFLDKLTHYENVMYSYEIFSNMAKYENKHINTLVIPILRRIFSTYQQNINPEIIYDKVLHIYKDMLETYKTVERDKHDEIEIVEFYVNKYQ